MTKKLVAILGAGFSANAGMPTANSITQKFNRDLRRKLLSASSSEWMWEDDKSDVERHNGRLNYDHLAYSYVFNELVKAYINNRGSFVYYEDFYQYIIDNFHDSDWVENLFNVARAAIIADLPYLTSDDYYKSYLFAFDHKQFQKVSSILNYLIGDILSVIPKTDEELINIYGGFIDYVKTFDDVDIFTLNHDVLLEHLFEISGINFSKGFNIENSPIHHNGNPVPFFNNVFNEAVRIHKLHGSLDFFQFQHFVENGMFSQPTGGYDYYLTRNYYVKHSSYRINPETGEVIQDHNFDIVPKFITGTKKVETIQNDTLYRSLFDNFESAMDNCPELFISGYSFGDEHLNEKMKSKKYNYINHNRSKDYPFEGQGKNIKSFDEL